MNKSRKNIRLFDKTWALTEEGGRIGKKIQESLTKIVSKELAAGFDPHDILCLIKGSMDLYMSLWICQHRYENTKPRKSPKKGR